MRSPPAQMHAMLNPHDDIEQQMDNQSQLFQQPRKQVFPDDGPNSHAGCRLIEIYELLELCLLHLPNEDILLAQCVSKDFHTVINTSSPLQEKLFFKSRLAFVSPFKAELNPIINRKDIQAAIPLFFDGKKNRLASRYQDDFTRLYCHSITATTVWVYLEFSSDRPSGEIAQLEFKTRTLRTGSWENMYMAQPSCFFSWRVHLTLPSEQRDLLTGKATEDIRKTYSGIVKGNKTMDSLLDGLVGSFGGNL